MRCTSTPALIDYSVRLSTATRDEPGGRGPRRAGPATVTYGVSPRASINLILAAPRPLAFVRGRDYALPQDVTDLALDVLRHRLVLSYEAMADEISADQVLRRVMAAMPVPDVAMRS